ncbi:MAG: hypothetical protein NPIRA06_00660 [Nitrospirales bacterium]|nr:MAG: hypothetical protein NPIRA06_00660 [Nitrospirales bacterium]
MPGLIGFTSLSPRTDYGKSVRLDALDRMREALTHRDWLVSDELFCDERVCATRVDTHLLQPDPQPYRSGDLYVWLDGELYTGSNATDPAFLADGFCDNIDLSFLCKLDGYFTAAVYDKSGSKIHLLTDRYGFRQLYWTVAEDQLWWGTELKAALHLPGFQPRVDRDALSQHLARGYPPGDKSLIQNIELIPEGTILTWDLLTGESTSQRYWDWDRVGNITLPNDPREMLEEWGRLFVRAVEKRSMNGRVGVMLSGGLDSRAILAAMPDSISPLHAVTFGIRDAADVRIAARAAAVRGAVHHVQELTVHNWLAPRFEGVWWQDGHLNLIAMHGMGGFDERREWFDINLSGFLGDVTMGGSYSRKTGDHEIDLIRNRGRRFIAYGLKSATTYFENRIPFFDNDLLEYTLSIPESQRARDHVYADMLLMRFPDLFKKIPWQETGVPITWPLPVAYQFKRWQSLFNRALHKVGVGGTGHTQFADYNEWLRQDPAKSQISNILTSKDAIYPEYVDRGIVIRMWEELQRGVPRCLEVGLYATLEIWLQQFFNARYRSLPTEDTTL